MRFDCTPYYHVGEQYAWDTLMDEMHQEVRLIDQGGFTGLWLAEHHFAWDGWYRASPNPILMGAGLIKNSDRLRIHAPRPSSLPRVTAATPNSIPSTSTNAST